MGQPRVADEADVRWITFDRPESGNALHLDDLEQVAEAVRGVHGRARAIAFTGSGHVFSGGMHLDTFAEAGPDDGRAVISRVRDCLAEVRHCAVPTVAVLNGHCVGAAFELALACDLRVAHHGVRVGLPEVKLGIPSVVEAALLHQYIGLSKAKELVLTGELYPLGTFAGHDLANRTVEPGRLRTVALELLASVTAHTPEVIAAQKSLFETWLNDGLQRSVDTSVDVFAEVFREPATAEAVAAYRSSRRPGRPTPEAG
ncbi:MAG: enoyl-CoA hydratase/isomerase family protein [Saccharopolyspora sp.]|uniref:enoyl-CoA hydratase/isomerase family protein n=1 Tax=Saccharopolyspora sp. TaxID=33915 RepID=UPI0025DC5C54|nr:enoyl-CoA hydratase/isomerase family protein [Saccharopolyspora sp.]MBQ6642021.1 enoyl-CoA hydratase/isomerase family protein [Saccharopolyspora sp.]